MKHTHHIIPRHMGGTDDPSNLVEVSVEEHANLHLDLYLQYGLTEDWIACQALSGQIGKEEIQVLKSRMGAINSHKNRTKESRSIAARKANTAEVRHRKRETQLGIPKHGGKRSDKDRELISEGVKKWSDDRKSSGLRVGRKPKPVLYNGVLYHNIKDLSSSLDIHLASAYRLIYSGKAVYQ